MKHFLSTFTFWILSAVAPSVAGSAMPGSPQVKVQSSAHIYQSKDSLASFLSDVNQIQSLEGVKLISRTHSIRDSSYTKSWSFEDWERHQVNALARYFRHLTGWYQSTTAIAILPAVAASVIWAMFVILLDTKFPRVKSFVQSASFGIGTFTAPIALLLTLKTNRALDRLFESRSQWGIITRVLASLAAMSVTYIAPLDPQAALLMGRYLSIFGWCAKGHFRGEEDLELLNLVLPAEEAKWLENSPVDHPAAIVSRIRIEVARLADKLPISAHQTMETRLSELESAIGICKRIAASPIPPTYSRHLSRILCVWLGLMPFALVGIGVSSITLVIHVALTSYVFVGIDEISVEIENPFPILPMFHLCTNMQKNVVHQILLLSSLPSKPKSL
jgi:putative membrane protein